MIKQEEELKTYFVPGQLVKVKHQIDNVPTMYVVEKVTNDLVNKGGDRASVFVGIKCKWFDKNCDLQTAIFSTKDLVHVNL